MNAQMNTQMNSQTFNMLVNLSYKEIETLKKQIFKLKYKLNKHKCELRQLRLIRDDIDFIKLQKNNNEDDVNENVLLFSSSSSSAQLSSAPVSSSPVSSSPVSSSVVFSAPVSSSVVFSEKSKSKIIDKIKIDKAREYYFNNKVKILKKAKDKRDAKKALRLLHA